ncbi:MAG: hypothetical protein DRG40_04105 [Deltaproteobacteria bacterium]|nr:MAG: hypothetical protein DRG40_04105 [Deltaproteobacteria bacterium]
MKVGRWIQYLRDHLGGLKKVLAGYLVVLLVFDVLLPRHHGHLLTDRLYLFWAAFGMVGCFALIKVSKGFAHLLLSKKEDYYD